MSPRVRPLTRLLAPTALLVLGTSCASNPAPAPGQDASAAKEAKAAKRAADLEQAQLQLEIATLEAAAAERAAQEAVLEAQREVEEAELALRRFGEYEQPSELAGARLSLDRAELSVRQNEAELQQMEEMYAAETNLDATGERTRDIVLERHRKALEFSRRQLELAHERYRDQEERELPRKLRELEAKRVKAEAGLRKAQEKQTQGELERKLTLLKARARVAELERGAANAKDDEQSTSEGGSR